MECEMKKIIPVKLITEFNQDGTVKKSLLQYQIQEDGSMDPRKFYTVAVKAAIALEDVDKMLQASVGHAEKAEKINTEVKDVKKTA